MMQSDRIKKMLHILKTNINDLNTHVSIIDYDIEKMCDYEQLTLHLKESYDSLSDLEEFLRQTINELNQAGDTTSSENTSLDSYISDFVYILDNKNSEKSYVIYKDFIIRSQLYYDISEDRYMSALDGDIIVIDKALPKISILTNLTKLSLLDDYIDIEAVLIDADTLLPIKKQALSLFLSSSPDSPVAFATTDKTGKAKFHFNLKDTDVHVGDNLLSIEYKGNKTYRPVTSSPILVNVGGVIQDNDNRIASKLEVSLDTSSKINLKYEISLDNKNLADGFREYSGLNISDTLLLNGDVLFYIDNVLIGQADTLINDARYSYASIRADLPEKFYDAGLLNVQAIFKGNDYFTMNIANANISFSRYKVDASDVTFSVEQPNIKEPIYHLSFSFSVDKTNAGHSGIQDIIMAATGDVGFVKAFLASGALDLYLYNQGNNTSKLIDTISTFNVEEVDDKYIVSAQPKVIDLSSADYNITEQDAIYIKGEYYNNSVIKSFSVSASTGYYFTGIITKNDSSSPVAGAKIALYDSDNITSSTEPLKESISDENGKFLLQEIIPGIYTVIISKSEENYTEKVLSSFYIMQNINNYNIHLYKRSG